ncbi:MAG: DUF72 domain-containing protein [Candidatus Bathyarchaeia archaeon]
MIKVGCCGYPTSMRKYHENFNLVEINTTFYRYPKPTTLAKWRQNAPKNFEFTVKAHQDITHKHKLTQPSIPAFEQMKQICNALNAHILLFQTPPSFTPNQLETAHNFFKKIGPENLTIAWETRGPKWNTSTTRKKLAKTLKELNITHVTDPLKTTPTHTNNKAYFRLHGLAKRMYYYQYTDEELKKLHNLIKSLETKQKETYLLFNNLTMLQDSLRFKHYLKTNRFPSLTGAVGLESVRHVIEKTKYPTTKSLLLKRVGWKLVETEENKQIRLNELLKNVPSKVYENVEKVLSEIKF